MSWMEATSALDRVTDGPGSEDGDGWGSAQDYADILDTSVRSVVAAGRYYCTATSASYPMLRQERPEGPHGRKWRYRYDDEAEWRGDGLRELLETTALTRDDLADALECSKSTVGEIIQQDRWIARDYQSDLDELADAYAETNPTWWLVCDAFCGRLVVAKTFEERARAEQYAQGDRYTRETCDPAVVRFEGGEPDVDTRIRESSEKVEVVG